MWDPYPAVLPIGYWNRPGGCRLARYEGKARVDKHGSSSSSLVGIRGHIPLYQQKNINMLFFYREENNNVRKKCELINCIINCSKVRFLWLNCKLWPAEWLLEIKISPNVNVFSFFVIKLWAWAVTIKWFRWRELMRVTGARGWAGGAQRRTSPTPAHSRTFTAPHKNSWTPPRRSWTSPPPRNSWASPPPRNSWVSPPPYNSWAPHTHNIWPGQKKTDGRVLRSEQGCRSPHFCGVCSGSNRGSCSGYCYKSKKIQMEKNI